MVGGSGSFKAVKEKESMISSHATRSSVKENVLLPKKALAIVRYRREIFQEECGQLS